ncbi:hypothetical protein BN1708_017934, partial [Verticillium longisporum]
CEPRQGNTRPSSTSGWHSRR